MPEAHSFKRDVVGLARGVFSEVARKRARIADVLDPGQACLALVGFRGHQERAAVCHALDVRGDPERPVRGAEDGRRADHSPWKLARAREHRLAPTLAIQVVERFRGLALERDEILLARRLAVEIRIHAGRYEDVPLALERPRYGLHLTGQIAREVEQNIGLHGVDGSAQLLLVGAVERDVAREDAVRPLLSSRRDGFDAAPHQLFARSGAYEA